MNLKNLFDLNGKVAIVTGGATGIGHQIAEGLAEFGSNLVIASRRVNLCEEVCQNFKNKYGIDAIAIKLDVTNEKDIVNLIKKTVDCFGKIDILVNNVGGLIINDIFSTSVKNWNYIIDLNITSTFLCCREAGGHMIKRKYGKIINVASVYSIMGTDSRNYVNADEESREILSYCTSKGAIINFTRDLAVSWAKYNITVNAISPGGFETEGTKDMITDYSMKKFKYIIPMGKLGKDDDLKGAAVLLASDASKYITGHNLVVDGGWSCW